VDLVRSMSYSTWTGKLLQTSLDMSLNTHSDWTGCVRKLSSFRPKGLRIIIVNVSDDSWSQPDLNS
jgi:hypothetical protein